MQDRRIHYAISIIRFAAAGNMLIHGVYRLLAGGVTPFDGFLQSIGLPTYTAWAITFFEIGAASCILLNKWVAPLSLIFVVELATGIFLVHAPAGWFAVGAGRNGMEYSVLLILCFTATALVNYKHPN